MIVVLESLLVLWKPKIERIPDDELLKEGMVTNSMCGLFYYLLQSCIRETMLL